MMNAPPMLMAVGTYTQVMPHVVGRGLGIHLLALDARTGSLREVAAPAKATNPSYLAASPDGRRLYGVRELDAGAALDVFAVEGMALRPVASIPMAGAHPCFVSVNPRAPQLYVANYTSGEVLVFDLDADGVPQGEPVALRRDPRHGHGPRTDRQDGPHAHYACASPDGTALYVCDLGTDAVVRHPIRDGRVAPQPDLVLDVSPGAGPRHLAFHPAFDAAGGRLAVVNELDSTVALYGVGGSEEGRKLCEASTLPMGWAGANTHTNTASAMRIHPNGKWLYASNRGHNSIVAMRIDRAGGSLQAMGWWPAGGRTPRDIAVTPDGAFLLAASQDDAWVRVFRIDPHTGTLHMLAGGSHRLQSPACLCLLTQARSPHLD